MAVSLPTVKHVCYALVRSLAQTLVITMSFRYTMSFTTPIINCSKDLNYSEDLEFARTLLTIHALADFYTPNRLAVLGCKVWNINPVIEKTHEFHPISACSRALFRAEIHGVRWSVYMPDELHVFMLQQILNVIDVHTPPLTDVKRTLQRVDTIDTIFRIRIEDDRRMALLNLDTVKLHQTSLGKTGTLAPQQLF